MSWRAATDMPRHTRLRSVSHTITRATASGARKGSAMLKTDIETFANLQDYARQRAAVSLIRNDPIAHAYWRETEIWAVEQEGHEPESLVAWVTRAHHFADEAKKRAARPMEAALFYSRAKWIVILGRNNGIKMPPADTGVNLRWLRKMAS